MNWIEQRPHANAKDSTPIYILVSNDEYVAFIACTTDGYQATVPNPPKVAPRGRVSPSAYYYTHDSLQDAKDWCIAELWKRRLDQ